ncbi:hypothetical protein BRADI_4g13228v3 [Brachypodium distachyon]|uniref:Uncharacterized protein n=1 Tax=Brachypodium distachyon TaxID=15368 RepID=A0A2K2CMG8_BRADI|nr:hypothetical protein BRADI_4g13228v3 [Brachypodium distachyon]
MMASVISCCIATYLQRPSGLICRHSIGDRRDLVLRTIVPETGQKWRPRQALAFEDGPGGEASPKGAKWRPKTGAAQEDKLAQARRVPHPTYKPAARPFRPKNCSPRLGTRFFFILSRLIELPD